MTLKLFCFLIMGTVAMGAPIVAISEKYEIARWKAIAATCALTITGTTGTFLMFFIENQEFGGLSFYGAVFLVPIVFLVMAPILRLPYGSVMDFCAVGECVMLALMKVHCYTGNCCLGRIMATLSDGTLVRFPSRLIEMVVAIILFVGLLRWAIQKKKRGKLYGWYLLLYGSTRFFLNILREAWTIKEMVLPFGNIWSIVAIVIAVFWLVLGRSRECS